MILNMEPQAGKEITKRRPVLVVSATKFNARGLAVVCPITSTPPKNSFHIALPPGLKVAGTVVSEQLKSLDYRARKGKVVEQAGDLFVTKVRNILSAFL